MLVELNLAIEGVGRVLPVAQVLKCSFVSNFGESLVLHIHLLLCVTQQGGRDSIGQVLC